MIGSVDLAVAARAGMGQDPVHLHVPDGADPARAPDAVRITWPYSNFGNNVYQVLNAALVASAYGLRHLLLGRLGGLRPFDDFSLDGLRVSGSDVAPGPCYQGSFYVPFGFEAAVAARRSFDVAAFTRQLTDRLYRDLAVPGGEDRIAVHVRSCRDIFDVDGPVHPAYLQPPAAYYIRAITHARAAHGDAVVDLVYGDRTNPVLPIMEAHLARAGVAFRSASGGLADDYRRLTGAVAIVASVSTFVETAALVSRHVRSYYSFRDHCSQSEFKPFTQANVGRILEARGVRCVLVDDVTRTYTNKWCWADTPEQRAAMRDFPIANLRLFEGA